MHAIYLASGSPRRREILENLGFTVCRLPADIDETPKEGEAAVEYVRRMACEKNQAAVAQWFAAHDQEPEFAVLTADTTVADGEAIWVNRSPRRMRSICWNACPDGCIKC